VLLGKKHEIPLLKGESDNGSWTGEGENRRKEERGGRGNFSPAKSLKKDRRALKFSGKNEET